MDLDNKTRQQRDESGIEGEYNYPKTKKANLQAKPKLLLEFLAEGPKELSNHVLDFLWPADIEGLLLSCKKGFEIASSSNPFLLKQHVMNLFGAKKKNLDLECPQPILSNSYLLASYRDHQSRHVTCSDNKGLALIVLRIHGALLKYASSNLKDDKEVVVTAVSATYSSDVSKTLKYASERLRDDKDVVLAAVKHDPYDLRFVSERLRDDKEVVMAAVKADGLVLKYASERLRDDGDVVRAAVGFDWQIKSISSQRERGEGCKYPPFDRGQKFGYNLAHASARLRAILLDASARLQRVIAAAKGNI